MSQKITVQRASLGGTSQGRESPGRMAAAFRAGDAVGQKMVETRRLFSIVPFRRKPQLIVE
jgi:hypothetical protein